MPKSLLHSFHWSIVVVIIQIFTITTKPISCLGTKERINQAIEACCEYSSVNCCQQNLKSSFGTTLCEADQWLSRSNCIENKLHGTSTQISKPFYCCSLFPKASCRYRCNNWLRSIRLPLQVRFDELEKVCPFMPEDRNRTISDDIIVRTAQKASQCFEDLDDARHVCVTDCFQFQKQVYPKTNLLFNYLNFTHCPQLHLNTNLSTTCLGEELQPILFRYDDYDFN